VFPLSIILRCDVIQKLYQEFILEQIPVSADTIAQQASNDNVLISASVTFLCSLSCLSLIGRLIYLHIHAFIPAFSHLLVNVFCVSYSYLFSAIEFIVYYSYLVLLLISIIRYKVQTVHLNTKRISVHNA